MVNWSNPATLERQTVIFSNIIHFVSGLYAWETAINFLYFDWSIISGKRHFRWPMVLYLACRYLMLFALVGVLVALNTTHEVNCQALYTFNQFAGNSAIGLASSLLMLRTIAVWHRNIWVTVPLLTISLGQWAILLHGMTTVVSSWNPQLNACIVVGSGTIFLDLIYFYTMSFDLIVLVLTFGALGLYFSPGRSSLWKLIFKDGIIFFALAFMSNVLPAVFIAINLNPVMNIMFSVPAACTASVFACRSFIRVATYSTSDKYAYSSGPSDPRASTRIGSGNPKGLRVARHPTDTFDSTAGLPYHTASTVTPIGATVDSATNSTGGVHVLMETFSHTTEEDKPQDGYSTPPTPQTPWSDDKRERSFGPDV